MLVSPEQVGEPGLHLLLLNRGYGCKHQYSSAWTHPFPGQSFKKVQGLCLPSLEGRNGTVLAHEDGAREKRLVSCATAVLMQGQIYREEQKLCVPSL